MLSSLDKSTKDGALFTIGSLMVSLLSISIWRSFLNALNFISFPDKFVDELLLLLVDFCLFLYQRYSFAPVLHIVTHNIVTHNIVTHNIVSHYKTKERV